MSNFQSDRRWWASNYPAQPGERVFLIAYVGVTLLEVQQGPMTVSMMHTLYSFVLEDFSHISR